MDRLLDLIADDPYANSAPSQLGRRRLKTRAPGMPSMPPMMSTLIDKPPNCHVSAITSDSINRIMQIHSNWTRSHGIISAPFSFIHIFRWIDHFIDIPRIAGPQSIASSGGSFGRTARVD
jgi:hypothetical protein